MDAVLLPRDVVFQADLGTLLNLDVLIVHVGYILHILQFLRRRGTRVMLSSRFGISANLVLLFIYVGLTVFGVFVVAITCRSGSYAGLGDR